MKILLETQRLILREFVIEDAHHIFKMHNDPEVMKYIPHKKPLNVPIEYCEKFIKHFMALYKDKPGYGLYAAILKDTHEFIGWNEINHLDDTQDVEIGYRYLKEHWGNGYATESSKALVQHGFDTLGLNRLVGVTMPGNIASQRVLEKIGMHYVEMRNYYNCDVTYYVMNKNK